MTNDEDVRAAADLIDETFTDNPRLSALTDEQLARLMVSTIASLAFRAGLPPSKIIAEITDDGWPTQLVTRED